ncbi:MAG TPA: PIN domain-containing protein [Thermoanaerobaculia bacterium]|nr:PIN domain-containing protein [Thermoanaerobaculia bacterium]
MTDDKAVLVDTNVLLSATAPLRALHRAAWTVLNDWPSQGVVLTVSSQVLREYLVVATRPVEVNGLGLGTGDALTNVMAFWGRMRLLVDSEPTWDRLRTLVATYDCKGKQIHDANVVASALASGVARLVTANVGDFIRFTAELELIDLTAL